VNASATRGQGVNQRLTPDLFCFPLQIGALGSGRAVGDALVQALRPLGLNTYAIGACPHPDDPNPHQFAVDNWPAEWREVYLADGMGERDPVLRAVQLNSAPVSLRDIREGRAGYNPTAEELAVLDAGRRLGRGDGLVVPIFGAQGYRGLGCVCGPGPDPDPRARVVIQFLVWHAHERMRTLYAAEGGAATLRLSLREREVLNAARRGLGDEEIAQAAAITVRTVRFHFENARRKLAARNRTEAIAKAVQLQLLGV
jgi:DNA-binding CsgD family transcriptional regulator